MDEKRLLEKYGNKQLKGADPRPYLDVGSVYHNDTISIVFGGSRQKGIKRASGSNIVTVFSTAKSFDDVYIRDLDVMLYHGANVKGDVAGIRDQSIDDVANGNRYLKEAYINGSPVLLFYDPVGSDSVYKGSKVVFMEPYYQRSGGEGRREVVFPLTDGDKWNSMNKSERDQFVEQVRSMMSFQGVEPIKCNWRI